MLWIAIALCLIILAAAIGAAHSINVKNQLKAEGRIGLASVTDAYVDPSNLHDPKPVIHYRFIHPTTNRSINKSVTLPTGASLPSAGNSVKVVYLPDNDRVCTLFLESESPSTRRAA